MGAFNRLPRRRVRALAHFRETRGRSEDKGGKLHRNIDRTLEVFSSDIVTFGEKSGKTALLSGQGRESMDGVR